MRRDQYGERFVDNDLAGISLGGCRCNQCHHVYDDGLSCAAFPDGIPSEILTGEEQHEEPYPGDQGIQFRARERVI